MLKSRSLVVFLSSYSSAFCAWVWSWAPGTFAICKQHTQRIPGLCAGVWLFNHTVIRSIILKVVRMLWLITSVIVNVKVKLYVGWEVLPSMLAVPVSYWTVLFVECLIALMIFFKNSLCSYSSGLTVSVSVTLIVYVSHRQCVEVGIVNLFIWKTCEFIHAGVRVCECVRLDGSVLLCVLLIAQVKTSLVWVKFIQ